MRLFYLLISSVLFFGGCTATPSQLPSFDKIKNPTFLIEDKKVNGKEVHIVTKREWKHVQKVIIHAGTTANKCITVLDNFNNR